MKTHISALLFCLCLCAGYRANAQSVTQILTGGDSREWELRKIDMTEGTDFSYEEFGDHDEFEEDSELAQLIPETVVFHSNGTCEMLYVSYFEEDDDTPYDNFTDSDITIKGRWRVSGNNVTITEDGGWVWSMNNLDFLKDDEGGYDFQCNLAFEGSTKDIQEIVYDWWPEDGDDGEEEEEDDDDDDDDGGGGNK